MKTRCLKPFFIIAVCVSGTNSLFAGDELVDAVIEDTEDPVKIANLAMDWMVKETGSVQLDGDLRSPDEIFANRWNWTEQTWLKRRVSENWVSGTWSVAFEPMPKEYHISYNYRDLFKNERRSCGQSGKPDSIYVVLDHWIGFHTNSIETLEKTLLANSHKIGLFAQRTIYMHGRYLTMVKSDRLGNIISFASVPSGVRRYQFYTRRR